MTKVKILLIKRFSREKVKFKVFNLNKVED